MTDDDTAAVLAELNAELAMLRGIRDPGLSAPSLDFEAPPGKPQPDIEPDEIEEAMERRQEQLRSSEMAHAKWERGQMEAALQKRDGEAREERQTLLRYLETLSTREDETGESMRSTDFGRMVP